MLIPSGSDVLNTLLGTRQILFHYISQQCCEVVPISYAFIQEEVEKQKCVSEIPNIFML